MTWLPPSRSLPVYIFLHSFNVISRSRSTLLISAFSWLQITVLSSPFMHNITNKWYKTRNDARMKCCKDDIYRACAIHRCVMNSGVSYNRGCTGFQSESGHRRSWLTILWSLHSLKFWNTTLGEATTISLWILKSLLFMTILSFLVWQKVQVREGVYR